MTETESIGFYDQLGAAIYDFGAPAVFFPLGGVNVLRERTLDELDIQPGSHVLELGCGTGALTEKLIQRGALVTAVDQSKAMLWRAHRRAPSATFVQRDILSLNCDQKFDRVLIAFVLHHMDIKARISTLNIARDALRTGGLIGILDWVEPTRSPLRWALHAFLSAVEPGSAKDWVKRGFETHLEQSGLAKLRSCNLAMGAARVVVAASKV